jgi:hypothetical protein
MKKLEITTDPVGQIIIYIAEKMEGRKLKLDELLNSGLRFDRVVQSDHTKIVNLVFYKNIEIGRITTTFKKAETFGSIDLVFEPNENFK